MTCQFVRRIPELTRNLLHLYRHDTIVADRVSGSAWYPQAHRLMIEWSDTYSLPIATVACVTSALSPQLEWTRNLIIADDLLAGRPPSVGGVLQSNLAKARRILSDRATQTLPYFPHGPKVASFACNLAGDLSIVTVDTHAMQAALSDVEADYRLRWRPYACFAEAYRRAAHAVSLEPAEFQAIIWHTWKRLYPRVSKRQRRQQWYAIGELED